MNNKNKSNEQILKDKITIKIMSCSFENKVKIKEMMDEFFKDKKITEDTLFTFYKMIENIKSKYKLSYS